MSLDEVKINESCKVVSIDSSCNVDIRDSFYKLGVFPGVQIKMIHKRRSPLQIRVGPSCLCSIRRYEAELIEVEI